MNNNKFIRFGQKSFTKIAIIGVCILFSVSLGFAQTTPPNPTQPTSPNQPTQPGQPTNPTQPSNPNTAPPTNQTQPANPNNPGNNSPQVSPTPPSNPTQTTQPANPTQPNQPNPSDSTNPANPRNPTQPNQSTNPTNPTNTSPKVNNQNPGATPQTPQTQQQKIGGADGIAPADLPLPPPPIEPDFKAPNRPLPSAERVGVDVTDQEPVTLEEAIALALENNTDIETSRIDVRISEFEFRARKGVFDPKFVGESFFQKSVTPNASTLGATNGATRTTNFTGNFGINGNTPIAGGKYETTFNSSRQTTDAPFTQLNPQFPTSFSFNYTQPLWRGLRIDDNRRQIQIARKNLSLSDAQFRQKTIDIITKVTQAYWELAYALRNLQVQIDAVKQAREQVASNQRQVDQGTIAPIDIVAADTQVTNFEQNVYAAQEQVTRAEANLKTLLLPDKNAVLWIKAIVPVTPVTFEAPRTSYDEALKSAYSSRPELDQLRVKKEINEIDRRFFKDQTKPRVDLVGSFQSAGLAGSVVQNSGENPLTSLFNPLIDRINVLSANDNLLPIELPAGTGGAVPNNLVGGYGKSLRNIVGLNYPTYQIGVQIELPIGNRTAKANYGKSLAEGTRIDTERNQVEQQIKQEVQTSLQALRSAEAKLASALASRNSTEQLYESEKRRYETGTSTIFLVLQRQQELVTAKGNELKAQTDLNKAISDFQKAVGNTFDANNIRIGTESTRQMQVTTPDDRVVAPKVRSDEWQTVTDENKKTP